MKNKWIVFLSQIKWTATLVMILLHCGALYGGYVGVKTSKWQTFIFGYILAVSSGIGTLAGAHRYFAHKSFKAKWQLRTLLCILQTLSGQKSIIEWAREHRTHHKYTGTDADCVNINRGFVFAHMGWILMETHPECEAKMETCDLSDLWSDPIIRFQYKHYIPLMILINIIIPTIVPYYLFDELFVNCFFGTFMFRYVYTLHVSFCGNSVAHIWGSKPYDTTITATHNKCLIYATLGGAYHNYHHVFPFDYSASELSCESNFNFMTALIDFFASIGWAYDLRRAPKSMIAKRRERTGDNKEDNYHLLSRPALDWILGLILSATTLWVLFALKLINHYFCIL